MTKKNANTESETEVSTDGAVAIAVGPLQFEVRSRYAEGHTITLAEAAALNQLVRENLRNTFRPVVQKAIEKAKEEGRDTLTEEEVSALTAEFTKREAEYEFSKARGPRAPADPVGREAYKLASQVLSAALAKQKIDPKSVSAERKDELIKGILEKRPDIREEAERRVKQAQEIANMALDL